MVNRFGLEKGTLLHSNSKWTPLMSRDFVVQRYIDLNEVLLYLRYENIHSRYVQVMTSTGEIGLVLEERLETV
jgi:hypothetical protein